jgi:hypothetical protein
VSWHGSHRGKKWRAVISPGGEQIELGYFPADCAAALAYDRSAILLFGPFACLNFSPEENAGRRALSDRAISKLIIAK